MPLDTLIFDPSPCRFPSPRVPLLPTGFAGVSFGAESFGAKSTWAPSAFFRHFTRGRYALLEAYRLAGVGPNGTLLAPAYHCRTMLDPALALGGNVVLYPLTRDLSPDLASLKMLVKDLAAPATALLATQFFGLPKAFDELAAWCRREHITLIEDCSHALFCEHHRPPGIGQFGEFVVSSPYKFLPSPDGGLLFARDADRLSALAPRTPGWLDELRGIRSIWTRIRERHRNLAALDPSRIDTDLLTIEANLSQCAIERHELVDTSPDYQSEHAGISPLRASRVIYRRPDILRIARPRQENYRRWVAATIELPHCRPLYPDLPIDSIPYMFPLIIDQPEVRFARLKRLGMPIFRWDSIVASDCAIANRYRLSLLHLPCHQSLTEGEMSWMISAVQKVSLGGTA